MEKVFNLMAVTAKHLKFVLFPHFISFQTKRYKCVRYLTGWIDVVVICPQRYCKISEYKTSSAFSNSWVKTSAKPSLKFVVKTALYINEISQFFFILSIVFQANRKYIFFKIIDVDVVCGTQKEINNFCCSFSKINANNVLILHYYSV